MGYKRLGLNISEKICSICKETLAISTFEISSRGNGYRGACKPCKNKIRRERGHGKLNEQQKAAKKKYNATVQGKAKSREYNLLWHFGMTTQDFKDLLLSQKDGCGICGTPEPENAHHQVDHDHTTGFVRGILCRRCNKGIGFFDGHPELLSRAITYLSNQTPWQSKSRRSRWKYE